MADRPILFSGPMVRALLAGTKTQTRRFIKLQPFIDQMGNFCAPDRQGKIWNYGQSARGLPDINNFAACELRIKQGDRLWVREHWRTGGANDHLAPRALAPEWAHPIEYFADQTDLRNGRFRQGMHMPRWASRLTLSVTDVRVERLQDCSEEDAAAEGVKPWHHGEWFDAGFGGVESKKVPARTLYAALWDEINGKGAWEANPWVAVYTFTVQQGNIDKLARTA